MTSMPLGPVPRAPRETFQILRTVLSAINPDAPEVEARVLILHAAGAPQSSIHLLDSQALDGEVWERLNAWTVRRLTYEPIAYILGEREFWGLTFAVSPSVLIPRQDSEAVVEAALKHLGASGPSRILDLGTGSGCLLLALLSEWPKATGLGVDCSDDALEVAALNAQRLGLLDRAAFVRGDWGEGAAGEFDLVVSNPPYIPDEDIDGLMPDVRDFEPHLALRGGLDGLVAYRRIVATLSQRVVDGSHLIFEVGYNQAELVSNLLIASGLTVLGTNLDSAGHPRAVIACKGIPHAAPGGNPTKKGLASRAG